MAAGASVFDQQFSMEVLLDLALHEVAMSQELGSYKKSTIFDVARMLARVKAEALENGQDIFVSKDLNEMRKVYQQALFFSMEGALSSEGVERFIGTSNRVRKMVTLGLKINALFNAYGTSGTYNFLDYQNRKILFLLEQFDNPEETLDFLTKMAGPDGTYPAPPGLFAPSALPSGRASGRADRARLETRRREAGSRRRDRPLARSRSVDPPGVPASASSRDP